MEVFDINGQIISPLAGKTLYVAGDSIASKGLLLQSVLPGYPSRARCYQVRIKVRRRLLS